MKNLLKKYSIILLIILSACGALRKADTTISADQSGSYIKLKKFKGDTLGYVQHNFIDNKKKYIGKDLNTLLKDVEIPIESYLPSTTYLDPTIVPHVYLFFNTRTQVSQKMKRPDKPVNIIIKWAPPLPKDSVYILWNKSKGKWSEVECKYFGKQTIEDLMTTKYSQ